MLGNSVICEAGRLFREYNFLLLRIWHSYKGSPAVILKAFASRTAVITSGWIYIPDLIGEDKRNGMIPEKDPEALLKAWDKLTLNRKLRCRITSNTRTYTKRLFREDHNR
ncbi:MAG: hypothetical protein U5O15_06700 [Candidatus Krumholzibacteriota bacterium]|nr:hypothetical protein [Candidatus Krumholzibacteriota bacterium]